ncbi:MAG: Sec-independent protein translocase protein TatB [Pseudomonadota bacterium]|nr:Sec-independent protein translocase protein TatB [Pseudomonadota bacterium]
MFDIGFTEIMLLGAIALIVLGPEKLPHAARMAGAWYGRIRRSLGNIQREIEQEVNGLEMKQRVERELASIRQAEQAMRDEINQIQSGMNTTIQVNDTAPHTPSSDAVQHAIDQATQAAQQAEYPAYILITEIERAEFLPKPPYRARVMDTPTA